MDTSYTAVEYFLSFFGSWRDGQDPAVLSFATVAPAQRSNTLIYSCKQNGLSLHKGRRSMGNEADMDFRRSYGVCRFFVFFSDENAPYESEKPNGRQRALCSLGVSAEAEDYLHPLATFLAGLLPCCMAAVPQEMIGRPVVLHPEKRTGFVSATQIVI